MAFAVFLAIITLVLFVSLLNADGIRSIALSIAFSVSFVLFVAYEIQRVLPR